MSVLCPYCRRRCVGGTDQWVSCLMCGRRFYSVLGGEGTEESPRFEPKVRKPHPPPDPKGPVLGYASLGCVLFFPLLAIVFSYFVRESTAALLTMGDVLGIGLGAAFGYGGLRLSRGVNKIYGGLGLVLSGLQAAWLVAAMVSFNL